MEQNEGSGALWDFNMFPFTRIHRVIACLYSSHNDVVSAAFLSSIMQS